MKARRGGALVVVVASAAASAGNVAFEAQPLGLEEPAHRDAADATHTRVQGAEGDAAWGTTDRFAIDGSPNGQDAWIQISPPDATATRRTLGLTGPGYTGSDGYQRSTIISVAGVWAIGRSDRVEGTCTSKGTDVWVSGPPGTARVGLFGPAYTGADDRRATEHASVSDSGVAVGLTREYARTGAPVGRRAWAWLPGAEACVPIGPDGPAFTTPDGGHRHALSPRTPNARGLVVGRAERFTPEGLALGAVAWAWDPVSRSTALLGPDEPAYAGPAGQRDTAAFPPTEDGRVFGTSARYADAGAPNGRDAWVAGEHATRLVGLAGPEHETATGFRWHTVRAVSPAGHAIGVTRRVAPGAAGEDAWVFDGDRTHRAGLADRAHTGPAGRIENEPTHIARSGVAAGYAARFGADGQRAGRDLWRWEGGVTRAIGLSGFGYDTPDGRTLSDIAACTDSGHVLGLTTRHSPEGQELGRRPWVDDGRSTVALGLDDGAHTDDRGAQEHAIDRWNHLGFVAGRSARFDEDGAPAGHTLWLYDPCRRSARPLGLEGGAFASPSGVRSSTIRSLDEHANAVGFSTRYAPDGAPAAQHAWYFDAATGECLDVARYAPPRARITDITLAGEGVACGRFTREGRPGPAVFVFRPDIGFADIGDSIVGGLEAHALDRLSAVRAGGPGLLLGAAHAGPAARPVLLRLRPCPADLNADATADLHDLRAFASAFTAGELRADLSADGTLGVADVERFVDSFLAGCP